MPPGVQSVGEPTLEQAKAAAEALWQLLDDIDTLDDWAKSNDLAFRDATRKRQQRRWKYMDQRRLQPLLASREASREFSSRNP